MDTKINQLTKFFRIFSFPLLCLILLLSCNTTALVEEKSEDPSPLDPTIRTGKLDNGFTYFIKPLSEPQDKLYMRLYNKAGSNQADEDQFNIPHGVEHLAFKATRNFPEGISNSDTVNKLGVGIFDRLAWSTSRATMYYFDAPPNSQEAFKMGLTFFKDIANGLKLAEEDINSVRGELRQEFIEGMPDLNKTAAENKLEARIFPCKTIYEDFLEHHKTFAPEVLRRFYKDWYRPDLLAISVVGNIEDVDRMELQIIKAFSDLKPIINPRKPRDCDSLYYNQAPQFYIVSRPPSSFKYRPDDVVNLKMYFRDKETMESLGSLEGVKRKFFLSMLDGIIDERFQELSQEYNSLEVTPRDILQRNYLPAALSIEARIQNMDVALAIEKIFTKIVKLKENGITSSEWKKIRTKQIENLNAIDVQTAKYWIEEIESYNALGEGLPANKKDNIHKWLSALTREDLNLYINQILSEGPEDIGILAPEGNPALSITEEEIRSWIKKEYEKPLDHYRVTTKQDGLMNEKDISTLKGKVIKDVKLSKSGATEYVLNNGLRLVLNPVKPTRGPYQDKIMIHGFTLKGVHCFPEEDHYSVINAPSIVKHSGAGGMDKFEIEEILKSKNIMAGSIFPYVDFHDAGIQGSVKPDNLETALQLIYLYVAQPRKDRTAFEDWKIKAYEVKDLFNDDLNRGMREITGDPSILSYISLLGTKSNPAGTEFLEGVGGTNLDSAYNSYKDLFSDPDDFTFVITGDFSIESVLPLLVKYLGNLPNSGSGLDCTIAENYRQFNTVKPGLYEIPAPVGNDLHNVKYVMKFITNTEDVPSWQEQLKVEALGVVFRNMLWSLRFAKGYSLYSVVANGELNESMQRFEVSTYLDCLPEEFSSVRRDALEISKKIKSSRVKDELFDKWMERMYSNYEAEGRGGRHLEQHTNLYYHYRYGTPVSEPEEVEKFIKALTPEDILETAKNYMQKENRYEFIMKNNTNG